MNTPADIWKLVLGLLQGRLQAVTLDAWFDDLTAVEFKDDTLLLHTPDKFKKEIIDERYLQTIKDALRDLFSADINVIVTTGDAPTPIAHNNYPEDEYTFEQFIVGSSNKFAHAAATAVANNPAKNYNPLFIYGQSGLGKTHLLYAICKRRAPRSSVIPHHLYQGRRFHQRIGQLYRCRTGTGISRQIPAGRPAARR